VLWLAFGWRSAQDFLDAGEKEAEEPPVHVVLIDDIDKADSDCRIACSKSSPSAASAYRRCRKRSAARRCGRR